MILLVDVGNTRLKWRSGGDAGKPSTAVVHVNRDFSTLLDEHWRFMAVPNQVFAVVVADKKIRIALEKWCMQYWRCPIQFLESSSEACGVKNAYHKPYRLGADRWYAMLGARHIHEAQGRPLCVIDCGTAITIDIIDSEGAHQGGWISPGLELMSTSMEAGTSIVRDDSKSFGTDVFARDTSAAVRAGTLHAGIGLVRQAMRQCDIYFGETAFCVLCGGDAERLARYLPECNYIIPDLVLCGMNIFIRNES